MRLIGFVFTVLTLGVLSAPPVMAQAPADGTTLVVFSRHTFRGVDHSIGRQQVSLPQFGLDLTVPMLSYGMEATPHGLALTQKYASPALNEAAAKAVRAVEPSRTFSGQWDEIRADLATSRTFFTALYLREGLYATQKTPILLTGCPTREGKGVDPVSIQQPVNDCIPPEEIQKLQASSPNLERLRQAGESLLSLVGSATGKPGPFKLEPAAPRSSVYAQLGTLASAIEMTSEQGPPLGRLFPEARPENLRKFEPEAVRRASNYLGVRFTALAPMEYAYACSAFPVQYINATPPGRHVVVLAHDSDLSALCRSVGAIADAGDIDDLAFYPLESIVFAIGEKRASIVRMRIKIGADGSIPGPFESRVMWQGSRAEWDQKSQKVVQQAQAWQAGAARRAELRIPPAQTLKVMCPMQQ